MANENISFRIQAVDNFTGTMSKFSRSMASSQKSMANVGKRMATIGSTMTKFVTTPLVGAGATVATMGAKFEKSMSEVQAVTQGTGKEMSQMEDLARDLGKNTQLSAKQASEGMTYLGRAGFETTEIMDAMPDVLDLSIAGNLELADAADIASNVIEGFGMDADQAGRMSDVLAKSAANANTDVGQLGEAMSYVAPVAEGAGISLEETSAAIGALSDSGVQGTRAGTSLRRIISSLQKPTGAAEDALTDLGLSMEDVDPTTQSLAEVMGKLEDAGMDSSQAMEIAGDRGGPALQAMLKQGVDGLEESTEALENSEGAAARMADTMQDNVQGAFKELTSAAQEVALQFYDAIKPALSDTLESVTEFVRGLGNMSEETQQFILKAGALVAAIGPAIAILGGLTAAVTALATPVGAVVAGLAALAAGGVYLAKKLNEPIVKSEEFSDKLSDSTRSAVESYTDLRSDADTELTTLAATQKEITDEMADDMVNTYKSMGNQIIDELEDTHEERVDLLSQLFADTDDYTKEEQKDLLESENEFYEDRKDDTQEAVDEINDIWKTASDEKRGITDDEYETIMENTSKLNNDMIDAVSKSQQEQKILKQQMKHDSTTLSAEEAAETAKNAIKKRNKTVEEAEKQRDETEHMAWQMYNNNSDFSAKERDEMIENSNDRRDKVVKEANKERDGTVDAAKERSETNVDYVDWETGEVKTGFSKMKVYVLEDLGELKDNAIKVWDNLTTPIVEKTSDMKDKITEFFGGMKDWVLEDLGDLKDNAAKSWSNIKDDAVGFGDKIKEGFQEKIESTVDWVKRFPGDVGAKIAEYASKVAGGVKQLATKLKNKFKDLLGIKSPSTVFEGFGKHISEGLVNGLSADGIKDFATNVLGNFKSGIFDSWSSVKSFFANSKGNIEETLGALKTGAGDFVGDVGGNLKKWVAKAIDATGVSSDWADPLATIAQKESGGRTGSSTINTWDSNALKGTPSMGVMQTIAPTFQAHKIKGMDDIMDPVDNIAAAINYIQSRYGNPMNTPGLKSMASGGEYKGYASGGKIDRSQWAWVGENGPELMHLNAGSRVYSASESKKMTQGSSGSSGGTLTADSDGTGFMNVLKDIRNEIAGQREMLRKQRDLIVEMDGKAVGKTVEPYVSDARDRRQIRSRRARGDS